MEATQRSDQRHHGSPGGSLLVVGTGIGLGGQVTVEALAAIKSAERLLFVAGSPGVQSWLRSLNANAISLNGCYAPEKRRDVTYAEMTERILTEVRRGYRVVAAFYGHPGVGVNPSHNAIRQARAEGFVAQMLPGVSADGCLYADLGLDPLIVGCQSYEASAFVARQPVISTAALLLLWQVGVIGQVTPRYTRDASQPGLERLRELLLRDYPAEHGVIAYEAAEYPIFKPTIDRGSVDRLPALTIPPTTTLAIPPVH